MMRDSSGGDYAATVIPITRSMIFWEPSEVCKWLEHLDFDAQVRAVQAATLCSREGVSGCSVPTARAVGETSTCPRLGTGCPGRLQR